MFADLAREVENEFLDAVIKHNAWTPANSKMNDGERLVIIVEEIGEVARAMTYDNGDPARLRAELIQTATMALAWVVGIDSA